MRPPWRSRPRPPWERGWRPYLRLALFFLLVPPLAGVVIALLAFALDWALPALPGQGAAAGWVTGFPMLLGTSLTLGYPVVLLLAAPLLPVAGLLGALGARAGLAGPGSALLCGAVLGTATMHLLSDSAGSEPGFLLMAGAIGAVQGWAAWLGLVSDWPETDPRAAPPLLGAS